MDLVKHNEKVEKIRGDILSLSGPFGLKQNQASNTLRSGAKSKAKIDLSSLKEVISIDRDKGLAHVESRVTMEKLVSETLKYGLLPLVVPEFKTITVGGAIMGAAIESSSSSYGQFNDSCTSMEFLLGNGEKIEASPSQNSDLFYGISGSYGTLAILTSAKLKLKRASSHVRLSYHKFNTPSEICSFLDKGGYDFLEGYMLSKENYVAVVGVMESPPARSQHYSHSAYFHSPFIDHVSEKRDGQVEYMPIYDYLFRLDRGAFWMGKYLENPKHFLQTLFNYKVEGLAKVVKKKTNRTNLLFRLLFGWAFSSKDLYNLWHRVPKEVLENLFLIHDFYAPVENAPEILKEFQEKTSILPIWLCPVKGAEGDQFLSPHFGKKKFINIGIYGIPDPKSPIELTKDLERAIIHFGGRKMLYSFCYYPREEFEKIYNIKRYNDLRSKYQAMEHFPSLYEKVTSF